MINWKKVGEHVPTSVNKNYPNSPETPYVSCLVFVCNPDFVLGGTYDIVRWDTKNKCWYQPDLNKWFHHEDHLEITHFCDEINKPE